MVCKRFEHPPPYMAIPPFYIFPNPPPHFYDFTKIPTTLYVGGVHSKYSEYHLQGLEKVISDKEVISGCTVQILHYTKMC